MAASDRLEWLNGGPANDRNRRKASLSDRYRSRSRTTPNRKVAGHPTIVLIICVFWPLVRRIWTVSTSCTRPRRTDLAGDVRHQRGDDAGELFERPRPDDLARISQRG